MKTESSGSTVLMIMLLMGVLSAFLLTIVHEGSLLRLFVAQQINAENNERLVHGLLAYGVVQAKKNYEYLMEPHESILELPLDKSSGRVLLTGTRAGIQVAAQLIKGPQATIQVSCLLARNSDKKFTIQGFQRESFAL